MNKIKTILVVMCVLSTIVFSCTTDENSNSIEAEETSVSKIGVFEDGAYLLSDKETLREEWEELQREQGNEVTFNDFSIVNGNLKGGKTPNLILKATSVDGRVKMATEIKLVKDKEGTTSIMRFGTTVTCSGCTQGCDPEKDKETNKWICTSCTASIICTKTVTVTVEEDEGIFGN